MLEYFFQGVLHYSGSQLDVLHISTMGKPSSGVLRRNQVESLCNGLI
jgi:hypothetical protein